MRRGWRTNKGNSWRERLLNCDEWRVGGCRKGPGARGGGRRSRIERLVTRYATIQRINDEEAGGEKNNGIGDKSWLRE
jgi:hypothetical protein